jgi:hypothetical protein
MTRRSAFAAFLVGALSACAPAKGEDPRPAVIRWGASAAEIEAALDGKCAKGFVNRPIEPPFLPVVEGKQVQIDCDGLEYLGAPRWAEFVIGDNRLQMVWIMLNAEDEAMALAALETAYGPPSARNADYVAFAGARAAWRFRPPEVLYYAEELDRWIGPDLEAE